MAYLGAYLAYLGSSVGLLAVGLAVYALLTPYRELALIRQGNSAAAFSLGGTAIGLALAIASAAAHSVSLLDMVMWAGVATLTQLMAYVIATLLLPGLRTAMTEDKRSHGIFLGGLSVAVGLLNAGALTT